MEIRDIMSKNVIIADYRDTVMEVAKLMAHHNIGCVPVTENGEKVLGMITDRDIILSLAKYNLDPNNTLASSIMTNNVYSVKPDADLQDALALMKKEKVRRLPVIDHDRLIGMVSLGDVAVQASHKYTEEISEALTEISTPGKPNDMI